MNPTLQTALSVGGPPAGAVAAAAGAEKKPPGKKPAARKDAAAEAAPAPNWPPELAAAFAKIPADDLETAQKVCQGLVAGGPATVEQIVRLVGNEFGDPNGVKPKYALHGLAIWAGRPGADNERKMVAETLAKQLAVAEHSNELKAFLVRQLQLCGRVDEAPAIAALLTSERLCEPAAQALQAIGGDAAAAGLRGALPMVNGKQRATVLQALGRLRDKGAAAAARQAAIEVESDVRLAALYALANASDGQAVEVAWKAAEGEPSYEPNLAADLCLLLGRRLAEQGSAQDAAKLFRRFLEARKAPEQVHQRCAALADLAAAAGADAVADVTAAMDSQELKFRVPAARTALRLARAILKDKPAEAAALLRKVLKATEEKAVTQQAETLLAEAGQAKPAAGAGRMGRRSKYGIA